MIRRRLIAGLEPILSSREIEVVLKRLGNKHITQTESNYLSRSIRPKLKSAEFIASAELLSLLDYRRRNYEREDRLLRGRIMKDAHSFITITNIKAIILFGSYVRNKHTNYRDIDVMLVLNKKIWKSSADRDRLEKNIEKAVGLKIDVQLIVYREIVKIYPYSPLLQTELEEHKMIYGNIKLNKKIIVNKDYLYKKLLEIEPVIELGNNIKPRYIYNGIRSCLAIGLFLRKTVDNKLIIKTIGDNIGKSTAESLLDDKSSIVQREISLKYLEYLHKKLIEDLQ